MGPCLSYQRKEKVKYGELEMSEARRLKAPEDENRGLKKVLAESRGLGVILS
jgi:hypothetical protein